ncbi:MAG: sigma-70 family RNA polymerase sigma factor [Lachnospiraceae bacterium]|nr:sigma-70 family RNA polymerase sigma factor [Lachnospiraceae bacterium]
MAKPYKIPDFRKMYPEVSEEIIAVLKVSERKMQYQEYDLKTEQIIIDQEKQSVKIIPSREDSYERLGELAELFLENAESAEEQALKNLQKNEVHRALKRLSADEEYLIWQLYFEERTERELAKELGIYHNAVHKQKKRILHKLKKILENL